MIVQVLLGALLFVLLLRFLARKGHVRAAVKGPFSFSMELEADDRNPDPKGKSS